MMDAVGTAETSNSFYQTTGRSTEQDSNLQETFRLLWNP
jgi:hypothetical protein